MVSSHSFWCRSITITHSFIPSYTLSPSVHPVTSTAGFHIAVSSGHVSLSYLSQVSKNLYLFMTRKLYQKIMTKSSNRSIITRFLQSLTSIEPSSLTDHSQMLNKICICNKWQWEREREENMIDIPTDQQTEKRTWGFIGQFLIMAHFPFWQLDKRLAGV